MERIEAKFEYPRKDKNIRVFPLVLRSYFKSVVFPENQVLAKKHNIGFVDIWKKKYNYKQKKREKK